MLIHLELEGDTLWIRLHMPIMTRIMPSLTTA